MKTLLLAICAIFIFIKANATIINIPADYSSIQEGIDNSMDGDTVLVQTGIYFEHLNYNGKNIVVASLFLLTNDTGYISTTTIVSNTLPVSNKSLVTFENNETGSAQFVGFTLVGGSGNIRLLGFDWISYGGAIYCNNASPALRHLVIHDNMSQCGGGIFLCNSSSVIENCELYNNVCNSIQFNSPDAGGAIALWNCSDAKIKNCKLTGNTVSTAGGGIYALNSTVSVINSLIIKNYSLNLGSAIYADSWSKMNIINCTIAGNHCEPGAGIDNSGVIYCIDSVQIQINNSIFRDNESSRIVFQNNYGQNSIAIAYSNLQYGIDSVITNGNGTINWLNGNIDADPLFIDTLTNNFRLQNNSPSINAGDTAGIANIPPTDLDGNNRIIGIIDMGCYENQTITSVISPENETHFLVYPNPAKDFLIINSEKEIGEIKIYDVIGKLLKHDLIADNNSTIDVKELIAGIYFIEINGEMIKWVKE